MTIQEATQKIKEMGFYPAVWSKGGRTRIYIEFNFKGSTKKGGFIGSDKTELVAQLCGKSTQKYQDKLNEIATWNIEWVEETKPSSNNNIHEYHGSVVERERMDP